MKNAVTLPHDFFAVIAKAQNAILFSVASALQILLRQYFNRIEILAVTVIISIGLHELSSKSNNVIWGVLKQSAVVQAGQSIVDYVDSYTASSIQSSQLLFKSTCWLLQTSILCLPAMVSSKFKNDAFIQNAVTVFLYQYSATMKEWFVQIDFGASPIFIIILAVSLTVYLHNTTSNTFAVHQYMFKAFHMLLVDLLLETTIGMSVSHAIPVQLCLQMLCIFFFDSIDMRVPIFAEVRGYAVWRLGRVLYALSKDAVDLQTALTVSILLIFARYITFLQSMTVQSKFSSSIAEIIFLVAMNHLILPIVSSTTAASVQHLLLVMSISAWSTLVQIYVQKNKAP